MPGIKKLLIGLHGLYAAVVAVVCVLVFGIVLLLAPGQACRRRIARWGLRITFFCAGMPFAAKGLERLPAGTCITIANHRSYLDGLVLVAALPPRFTPVMKVEVSRVPVVSLVLRRIGCRYVQREPAVSAGRDTMHLLDALGKGESLAMFPEGTFSVDEGLLPFRGGASFLAAKTGVPVVPVAIRGTRNVLPVGRLLPCPAAVRVEVLDAVRPYGMGRDSARELRDQAEAVMWHGLKPHVRESPQHGYGYYSEVFRGWPLPQAYLDLDLLERNIRAVLDRSGGKRLRVDAGALRCPAVIDRVLRSNIRFHGVKCATGFEAAYLAREWGLEDMLVAYPTLQRDAIDCVCAAVADGCEITMTADSPTHLTYLSAAAAAAGITLPVCVEMDLSDARVSRRSPLRTVADLLALVDSIAAHGHLHFRGVLAFDTQGRSVPAWFASPRGRGWLSRQAHADNRGRLHQRRRAVYEALAAHGYMPTLFSGGGGGALEFNAMNRSITELTIGSALFAPEADGGNFDQPAAGFVTEVMRRPGNELYVCLGGGYVAADTLAADALPRPCLPSGAALESPRPAGVGHIPIRYAGELRLGDPVFLRSPNAGELCERFSTLLLVQGGAIVGSEPTYRALGGRLLCAQAAPRSVT